MPVDMRPAAAPRSFKIRRDWLARRFATAVTVLTATIAVMAAAAATVAIAIN